MINTKSRLALAPARLTVNQVDSRPSRVNLSLIASLINTALYHILAKSLVNYNYSSIGPLFVSFWMGF